MNGIDKILHYMFLCHRIPERSFFYKGKQLPICARCTGILIGYLFGIIYIIFSKKPHLLFELLLLIPIAIDGLGQLHGYWTSNNTRRLLTGILAGIATIEFFRIAIVLGLNTGRYIFKLIIT
jgi:uncharacterized membrane protein